MKVKHKVDLLIMKLMMEERLFSNLSNKKQAQARKAQQTSRTLPNITPEDPLTRHPRTSQLLQVVQKVAKKAINNLLNIKEIIS